LVLKVLANTPAAAAGMRIGDVVTAVDGKSITNASQFQAMVENTPVGQALELTVQRGKNTQTVAVKTGELKAGA
jgi:S1-C subfamily serine protease